jgi:hypothetical protein
MENLTVCHLLKQLYFMAGVLKFQESVYQTTEFCAVAPNISRYWVLNVLQFTLLAPRSLRWILYF